MITKNKVDIYIKYAGDIDFWARSGSKKEKLFMNDEDWYIIDRLFHDFSLVKKGLTSSSFKDNLENKLKDICDSKEVIQAIQVLSTF
jgi:hypothetical protein